MINEMASQNLFARNMFIRQLDQEVLRTFVPDFTVIDVPSFHALPEEDGTRTQTFILLNFAERMVLIGGTAYSGEMKKAIFAVMNYLLPKAGVMSMHCSANYGADKDDVALFFGLSGTGKTTLSAAAGRTLMGTTSTAGATTASSIWKAAVTPKSSIWIRKGEPEIYETTRRFGTILENVT